MQTRRSSGIAPLLLVGLTACSSATTLRPTPGVPRLDGSPDAALDTQCGVRVVANANAWTGPDIRGEVLPIRVSVMNDSGHAIAIRYREVELVAPSGKTYAAVPPRQVQGAIEAHEVQSCVAPALCRHEFSPHSRDRTLHPCRDPAHGTFVRLPTPEMLDWAMPERVIESGSQLAGFLYFQPVEVEQRRVTFRLRILDAKTEHEIGVARIPFAVVEL